MTLAEQVTKLRIVVARFGEMDRNKWWNTKGLLSSIGEMAISRGLPKTHVFARCRSAFAVASARSDEVFNPPNSFTLWRLPVEIEDKIEDEWATWIGNPEPWDKFIKEVDGQSKGAVADVIAQLGLASEVTLESLPTFKRASDFRSVPIKAGEASASGVVELLARAHISSEPGKLAVPFVREEEFPK